MRSNILTVPALVICTLLAGCAGDRSESDPVPRDQDAATVPTAEQPAGAAASPGDSVPGAEHGTQPSGVAAPGAQSDAVTPRPATTTPPIQAGAGADDVSSADGSATGGSAAGADDVGPGEIQQLDPPAILRRTASRYQEIRSLRSPFTMQYHNPLLRSRRTSRGTLYQRRPDRIKLDFSDPEGDLIVSDGRYFWLFYPSTDPTQVLRTPADRGTGGVDLQAQFVGDPVRRFEYTHEGEEAVAGRRTHVFTLVPREQADYARLKVWIDAEDALIRRFEVTDREGPVRLFDLTDLQLNPTLADSVFEFQPPAGVRVVDRG
jgi:outer membrane lipoprotein carrier protein